MAGNIYHKHHHQRRKKKKSGGIDNFIYVVVVAGPLMTIPQIISVWDNGADSVSLLSWVSYLIIAFVWLAYGIKHREKPIIAVQIGWIVVDLAVVVGLLR